MELRKVQLTGGSSITVTLPKTWVERVKLEPGDIVGCSEQPDGSIAILPHAKGERAVQQYRIDVADASGAYLFRKIIAAYLMGYDVIVVRSREPLSTAARSAVRKAVRRIMGLEVTEEDPNSMTLQDFLDPREFHMDKALRRMGMLSGAMQDEAGSAIRNGDAAVLESVRDRDNEVDRLYWLVNKQYHAMLRDMTYASKMELTTSQALNLLLVARLIERTADHALRVAEQAIQARAADVPDEFMDRLGVSASRSADLFKRSLKAFQKRDPAGADAIIEEALSFQDDQQALLRDASELGGEAVSHLAFLIESIGRTAAYAADVSEVAINHKVASAGVA